MNFQALAHAIDLSRTHLSFRLSLVCLLISSVGCQSVTGSSDSSLLPKFTANTINVRDLSSQIKTSGTVYLKGKVKNRAPLLDGTVYELKDDTGSVWVLAKTAIPNSGEEVTIKGVLRYQTIQWEQQEQNAPYVEQQERL
ncbi:hypothetical protein [Pantanalinema sp. GBBB05]|uniref:hypothetical protein n=1 Tax=Pantanalinema sp. GBBB05 TaxID=2604139 RepID=UPI001E06CE54|nr:hypothetical protein [Pantanalinema sp. GBBB05]